MTISFYKYVSLLSTTTGGAKLAINLFKIKLTIYNFKCAKQFINIPVRHALRNAIV